MKRAEQAPCTLGRMSDASLSQKLGHYGRMEKVWIIIGLLGILGGILAFFLIEDQILTVILVGFLFGGGICSSLFLAPWERKKGKALVQKQLGAFFRAELETSYGPALHTSEMRIDTSLLKQIRLLEGQWEECLMDNFYEGIHEGIHFSVANVTLYHLYQGGHIRDGRETRRDRVFHGLVLRWETSHAIPHPISIYERTKEKTDDDSFCKEPFDYRFGSIAEGEIDMVYKLQLMEWIDQLEQNIEGKVRSLYGEGNILSMAIETDYVFASVASHVDRNHVSDLRRSYSQSVQEIGHILDLLQAHSPWK